MTRRSRPTYPSPGELALRVRTLCQDALAIVPMYQRLHSMGAESERGESVHVSGGGVGDPTGAAIESRQLEHHREYARYVAQEIDRLSRKVDRLRQGLEHNIGPTPGYRQPQSIGSDAIVSVYEFTQARTKQAERLRSGTE